MLCLSEIIRHREHEMNRITLPVTDITTTRLGFGGSNLLGNKTRAEGLRLLETAYDVGVRHFDVARYYGFGAAESLVGEFAQNKRDRITITTKFGIQPPSSDRRSLKGAILKLALPIARRLIRLSPQLRNLARKNVSRTVKSGEFSVASASNSLETSLKELQTDYIDLFLLHDCEPDDCTPDLLAFLEEAREQGKIRAYGVGTLPEHVETICVEYPEYARVTQFHSSVVQPHIERIASVLESLPGGHASITHGAVGQVREIKRRLEESPSLARRFEDQVDADWRDPLVLPTLVLQHALHANRQGVVLFQSESPERIHSNVRAAFSPTLSDDQIQKFKALAASE